jgi:serine/threonine-protein kinase RsbW
MLKAFAVSGDPDQIPKVRHEVAAFLEEQGCPEESCFEIGMALQEALANAVIHGCGQKKELMVSLLVETNGDGTMIVVRDPGPGFVLTELRDPATREGLAALSGRGVTMMRAYMDDVEFAHGGSEVRMRKRWKAGKGA